MNKLLFFFLLIIKLSYAHAQFNANNFIGIYYGLGTSVPVGSFSKNSGTYNQFGKAPIGLNMKAGAEFYINDKNAISIDLDYGFFFNARNDSLARMVKRRVDSYGIQSFDVTSEDIDISMSHVSIGYSRFVNFKNVSLQAKIGVGKANFGYDFIAVYALSNIYSAPSSTTPLVVQNINYSFDDYGYFTIKPELNFKYLLKQSDNLNTVLGLNIGYFYARPKMTLYENKDSKISEVVTLKDNIHIVNINISLNLIFRKSILSNFRNFEKNKEN